MKKWFCLFLICVCASSVLDAAYPDEYPIFLRLLGFSKDEIRHLHGGSLIAHTISKPLPGEFGIVAAQVSNIPSYYFRDYFRYVENFSSLTRFADTGKFSDPPNLQDFKPLLFSSNELHDFLACRTGPCDMKLFPEEIQAIPAETDLDSESGRDAASTSYRELLLKRLRDYQDHGSDPESAKVLQTHLSQFTQVPAYFPHVQAYLLQYPKLKEPKIDDLFYWIRESIGKKPVISIHHVFSQRVGEDYVLVNRVIFGNHYFVSSMGVIHLLNYADRNMPATLILYEQRTLTGPETGAWGRNTLRRNMEKQLTSRLKTVSKTLEARYRSREYLTFPYRLLPRDQR